MSLIHCAECGHEISQNAVACPNCGRPLQPTVVVEEKRVVPPTVVAPVRREKLPPWAIALMGILGVLLLFVVIMLFRGTGDDGNVNLMVNANRRQADSNRNSRTTDVPSSDTQTATVPNDSQPSTTTVPGTSTGVPVAPPPDKGSVVIRAKLVDRRGQTTSARGAKFYLLDKDVETILSEARVEPIEGNTLSQSIGLAAVYPARYGEFQRAAMRAISANAKYSGTTDSSGAASLSGVAPESYYLFAIMRVGSGFALWSSPVSVIPGENVLELSPQSITEISSDTSG